MDYRSEVPRILSYNKGMKNQTQRKTMEKGDIVHIRLENRTGVVTDVIKSDDSNTNMVHLIFPDNKRGSWWFEMDVDLIETD